MNDLPNELLDEIFSYVNPMFRSESEGLTPLHSVCRRWNRPFRTRILESSNLPQDIDLQATFPQLVSLRCWSDEQPEVLSNNDYGFFKGHRALRKVDFWHPTSLASLLNCPRLTHCTLYLDSDLFFKRGNLDALMTLSPLLVDLSLEVIDGSVETTSDMSREYKLAMCKILDKRLLKGIQGFLNLKSLSLTLWIANVDPIICCMLFASLSLSHLEVAFEDFKSDQISIFFAQFPNLDSLCLRTAFAEEIDEFESNRITKLEIRHEEGFETFSLMMRQFPNLEVLDTGVCSPTFDITEPTRIINLATADYIEDLKFCVFPCLRELKCPLLPDLFKGTLRDLQVNCPQLTKINFGSDGPIDDEDELFAPDFDQVTFPCLTHFQIEGSLKVNSSLVPFLVRHPKLEVFEYCSDHFCECNPTCGTQVHAIPSNAILWPNLTYLEIRNILWQIDISFLRWLRSNAPNLVDANCSTGTMLT